MGKFLRIWFGVGLVACGSVYAYKPSPKPTPENLVGAWVSSGAWGYQYRLVLKADGTGRFGLTAPDGDPSIFKVERTEIDGYRIRIVIGPRAAYSLTGDGTPRSFTLKGKGVGKLTFYREQQIRDATNGLISLMDQRTD